MPNLKNEISAMPATATRNPYLHSYTKLELRYLVIDPDYDLTKLKAPIRPDDIQPMNSNSFVKNVRLMLAHQADKAKFTIAQFLDPRYTRAYLPACWCREILKHMIGE